MDHQTWSFIALTLIGVTDTPNHARPEAALIGEVEAQHVIVTAETETETERGRRTEIETGSATVRETERLKEMLKYYLQYLKKVL